MRDKLGYFQIGPHRFYLKSIVAIPHGLRMSAVALGPSDRETYRMVDWFTSRGGLVASFPAAFDIPRTRKGERIEVWQDCLFTDVTGHPAGARGYP